MKDTADQRWRPVTQLARFSERQNQRNREQTARQTSQPGSMNLHDEGNVTERWTPHTWPPSHGTPALREQAGHLQRNERQTLKLSSGF